MPINFNLQEIKEKYQLTTFFETGLYVGNSVQKALDAGFEKVVSIEISSKYVNAGRKRFGDQANIIHDDSKNIAEYLHLAQENTFYWLDAHADQSGLHEKGELPCPILAELSAIQKVIKPQDVIAIDDMRIIKTNGGWGGNVKYQDMLDLLNKVGDYDIQFMDGFSPGDVLVALPKMEES